MPFSPEDPNFKRNMERRGEESRAKQEANKKLLEQKKEERERRAAQGATGTKWEVARGGAAVVGFGGLYTLGQVLKYSLLGWTLDANGMPRKDAAALKTFEDTYKAAKDEGVIAALGKGLGIAA